MSRKPSKRPYKLLPWCTASPDSQDPVFIQLGCSLMQHPAFLALTAADRHCYLCMVLEAKGQMYFQFCGVRQKYMESQTAHYGKTSSI